MPELSVTTALAAAAPLLLVIVLMAAVGRSAASAGALGLALAAVLAVTIFGIASPQVPNWLALMTGIIAETVHSIITILWIILAALVLFEYQKRSGGIDRIRETLASFTDNRRIEALLIAWFFGLFIEGAAGFGTPVALAAPLLVGVGFPPVRAVAMALVGHAAGVPFGAVGTPTLAQIDIAGLPPTEISGLIAAINCLIGFGLLWVLMRLAEDGAMTRQDWTIGALAGVCFVAPFLILANFTGPELPALAGAMIGLAVFLMALRAMSIIGKISLRPLVADLVPYLVLVGLILVTRLIPQVKATLNEIAISWELMSVFSGSFAPLYHPGTLMMLSIVLAAVFFQRSQFVLPATGAALMRLLPVGVALMLMLALSRTMVHTGMIETLAQSAALTGVAWPMFAPLVGTLGTFVSGSATTSNILFTEFQVSTAELIGLTPVTMIAAQGIGAAIGNMIAPHNIIAGCATVGLAGKEGVIMRTTVPAAFGGLAVCGLLALQFA